MTTVYIVLLLVANGFFVAAEFALVKVPAVRVESLAAQGSSAAKMTLRIAANLETYLATCQLGITMASLGLGWLGEPAVAALLKPALASLALTEQTEHLIAFFTGFIIFSALHIVVGEQVPKTYAIRRADKVALWIAYPLHVAYVVTYPLTKLLNIASSSTLRLLGVEEVSHADVLTGAEIRGLIDASKDHGTLDHGQAQMMQNVFTFHDRPVARIMLPSRFIETVDLNATRAEIIVLLSGSGHSRLAVLDGNWGQFKGVVLIKELLLRLLDDTSERPLVVHEDLLREPQFVPENQPVPTLFASMQESHQHIAFAVDEYGDISGLITLEDLLEEIVGEISDESDGANEHAAIVPTEFGWQCEGLTLLSDIERVTGLSVDAELNANTVSGLFMDRLLKMPKKDDVVVEGDHTFTINAMRGRQAIEIAIVKHVAVEPLSVNETPTA
ncbi:MAG: CBS domain containing-hemolysin-like protein [Gammaproteobacteria bacterium]|jgi:CBS domain containing-hemolysin-like protein